MFDFSTQYDVHPAIGAESSIMSVDQGYFDSNSCSSMPYQHPWAPELPFFEYLSWNLDDTPVAYSPPLSSELSPHQAQMAQQPPPDGPLDLPNPTPFLHTYTFEPSPQQPPSPFTQEQLPTSLCTSTHANPLGPLPSYCRLTRTCSSYITVTDGSHGRSRGPRITPQFTEGSYSVLSARLWRPKVLFSRQLRASYP